jgi:putative MATE family efflux protein
VPLRHKRFGHYWGDRAFYREALAVGLPIILQQLIASGMGFVDGVMVGQIDARTLASVAVTNKYFLIMQCMLFGVTGGLGIFISQYFGAEDHEKGQGLFVINILGSVAVAGLFFTLISLFPRAILSLFVNDPATLQHGQDYLHFVRFSYLPYAISLACMTALRSIGETRKPLIISSLAILLNTGLNYLLIFGNFGLPALGVGGAGLATLISRLTEMLLYLVLLGQNRQYFNLRVTPVRLLNKSILKQILRKTLPLISNELAWSIGNATMFWTYCQIDETFIASLTVVEMTANLVYVVIGGLGAAISVLVGARLGADRFDEARDNARRLITGVAAVILVSGILVIGLSGKIPLLFNLTLPIQQLAGRMLRINALFYVFNAINVGIFLTLRIGGDVRATLLMDSLYMWAFVIPLALVLSLLVKPGIIVFYWAIQLTDLLKLSITSYLYRKGRWIRNLT